MKLSVVIVSYKSDHLLEKILKDFSKKHEIIIIENSLQASTKKNIEKKYSNAKVIIPPTNLGYAAAFNLGFKRSKNQFVLTLTPDVLINKKLIFDIEKLLNSFKNFTLLSPEYKNKKIHKNFIPIENLKNQSKISKYRVEEVKDLDWCFCIINKSKFKNKKILDENFFLYFETTDLCKNLFKQNKKMYVVKNLKFDHLGTGSSNKKYNSEIQFNRNWHFCWSKFYLLKKNYGYLFALKKLLPNIFQSIIGILASAFKLNIFEIKLHFSSLMGTINGIILNKSHYRPNIK